MTDREEREVQGEEPPYAPHPGVIVPDGPMPEVPPGPQIGKARIEGESELQAVGVEDEEQLHGKEERLDDEQDGPDG